MNETFAATVGEWCENAELAAEVIFKEAAQEVANDVVTPRASGGRMRYDTGFLAASLMASTSIMPSIIPANVPGQGAGSGSYAPEFGQISLVINGADLGDTIFLGFTAAYAAYREYGANGQAPDAFVRTTAQKWPQIVAEKEALVRARLSL